jgi:hypothetical protein
VGALVIDTDRLAALTTTTPYAQFDLLITPEPSGNVTQPSHDPVMKAKIAPKE